MINLTSPNDDNLTIKAEWDSPDSNSSQYEYKIILDNMTYTINGSKTKTLDSLIPGTKYTLNVSASVPGCSEEGEAASISAYTSESKILLFLSLSF